MRSYCSTSFTKLLFCPLILFGAYFIYNWESLVHEVMPDVLISITGSAKALIFTFLFILYSNSCRSVSTIWFLVLRPSSRCSIHAFVSWCDKNFLDFKRQKPQKSSLTWQVLQQSCCQCILWRGGGDCGVLSASDSQMLMLKRVNTFSGS